MPPKRNTRSTRASTKAKDEQDPSSPTEDSVSTTQPLKSASSKAVVFIAPKEDNTCSSTAQTILTLPHPLTSKPTRYLLNSSSICEITVFQSPPTDPTSWLLVPSSPTSATGSGETVETGALYMATPVDPIYLLIPSLFPTSQSKEKRHFVTIDDLFDELIEASANWRTVISSPKAANLLRRRLASICDSVDAGDEKMYKPSLERLAKILAARARKMALHLCSKDGGSMAAELVDKPLTPPHLVAAALSTPAHSVISENESRTELVGSVRYLQALSVAHQYFAQALLPGHIAVLLMEVLKKDNDFAKLETHLKGLKEARTQVTAARAGDFSLKRGLDDEEEVERDEKRRKKLEAEEEEKKKRKSMSKAQKDLEKVNTKGMMKLSSFFTKKT
ncbi:hypothetical protein BJ508DRAFT_413323 [Ascobolus immersus RN42]|uniref:Ribonuclease H2 subunit B n=1 Tax=Ascobolus immersus RN42 TaxID=1160509 RepID=A0A3N4IG41_ASCIM|nr:hypothetical protein BJ508DRAFT_413323 [Ascobolus immersus RN42]